MAATTAIRFSIQPGTRLSSLTSSSDARAIVDAQDLLKGSTVQSQSHSFGLHTMTHKSIEAINITASFDGNDIALYQDGSFYDLGEALLGNDRDTFAADFRGQDAGIDFSIGARYETQTGKVLANGVLLSGMDRAVAMATIFLSISAAMTRFGAGQVMMPCR